MDPSTWRDEWFDAARQAGPGPKEAARGRRFAVSAQHPCSTLAGRDVLGAGGSAVDAVVAMTAVDTVVQPGTSSLGGVLTMLVHDTSTGRTHTLGAGFNSVAGDTEPYRHSSESTGGRAVLVPGTIAGLDCAWRRFGRVPWVQLWQPAVHLAHEGFPLTQRYALAARWRHETLLRHPAGRAIFAPAGELPDPGAIFRQPALAATLEQLGAAGADYAYRGRWAEHLVAAVADLGGLMSIADLAGYRAHWDDPLTGSYLGRQVRVCPPPQHGGAVVLLALAIAETLGLHARPPRGESADSFYDETQAVAAAISACAALRAPRPDPAAHEHLFSPEHVATLAARIRRRETFGPPTAPARGSHCLAAADEHGLLAVATHTISALPWGDTGLFVDGIALNSARVMQGAAVPPGGRVPDTLATQLVLDGDQPVFAAAPVGSGLHGCLVQNTIATVGHGLDLAQATDQDRWGYYDFDYVTHQTSAGIQTEPFTPALLDAVERVGQPLVRQDAAGRPYGRADRPQTGQVPPPTMGRWAAVTIDATGHRQAVTDPRASGATAAQ